MNRFLLSALALGLAAVPALAQPDLSVTLTGPPTIEGTSGSSHSVGFTVFNSGNAPAEYNVRARVPAGARFETAVPILGVTIGNGGRTLTYNVPALILPGSNHTLPFNLRIVNEGVTGVFEVEIMTQNVPDLDSTPGDGVGDDYASRPLTGTPLPALPADFQVQAVTFGRLGTPYAAVYGRGVYRFNAGTWQPINAGLTNLNVWDVHAIPTAGADALVAGTIGGGLYRYDPITFSWTPRTSALRTARGVEAVGNNTFYATGDLANGQGGVVRSDDDGRTWMPLGIVGEGSMEPWSIAVVRTTTPAGTVDIVYVGTRRGLYKSIDSGMTFAPTGFIGDRADAFDVVAFDNTVIVGTRDGIRRSTDGGATFGPLIKTTPAASRSRNVYDLEYRPAQGLIPARLYVSHWGRPGVVVSTDFGLTFFDIPLGVNPDRFVDRVFIAPNGTFYLSMEAGGLHVTAPAEATASDTEATPEALALDVTGSNPFVGRTALRLGLATTTAVRVDVYDALGRRVQTLADGTLGAGTHALDVSLDGQAAGIYLVRATAGGQTRTVRLVTLR